MRIPYIFVFLFALELAQVGLARPVVSLKKPANDVSSVIASIERHYGRLKSYAADFHQVYTPKSALIGIEYKGTVIFKKPGKMRWDYRSPEKKQIIADGIKIWLYKPEENQVIINDFNKETLAQASGISFLWGKSELAAVFTAAFVEHLSSEKHQAIELHSKIDQPYYEKILFLVDRKSFRVDKVIISERSGGTNELVFSKVVENKHYPDTLFTYKKDKKTKEMKEGTIF